MSKKIKHIDKVEITDELYKSMVETYQKVMIDSIKETAKRFGIDPTTISPKIELPEHLKDKQSLENHLNNLAKKLSEIYDIVLWDDNAKTFVVCNPGNKTSCSDKAIQLAKTRGIL